ncbi:MAG: tRNA pseudouridine(38-40) synthase TruA [Alphaproteobacteria bacterium]
MRIKLVLEYDGTPFAGWQSQNHAVTVQGVVQDALKTLTGQDKTVHAAGRTDAGVHASGQVIHLDHDGLPLRAFVHGVNAHLRPWPVVVLSANTVPETFHARFSAVQRRYCYRILHRKAPSPLRAPFVDHYAGPLDVGMMNNAAQRLVGTHDFSAFRCAACQAPSAIKTLDEARIEVMEDELHLHFAAKSFLHNQVRIMVGTLLDIGRGQKTLDDLHRALITGDRRLAGATRPPQGLTLVEVRYGDEGTSA